MVNSSSCLPEKSGKKTHSPKVTVPLVTHLLSQCWLFIVAVLVTGMTTTMVYPGAISLIKPAHPDDTDWDDVYFSQVRNRLYCGCTVQYVLYCTFSYTYEYAGHLLSGLQHL